MNKLIDMQEALGSAKTLEHLQSVILGLRDVYDMEHLVYHSVNSTGEQYAAATYDPNWVNHYLDSDYARVDPVVQGCYRGFNPIDWKTLDWSKKAARNFFQEAISCGVGNQGFSVPIRGPSGQFAVFTVNQKGTDETWAKFTQERSADLLLLSHYINEKALELEGASERTPMRALSPRERDALTLLATGQSRAAIADALQISESTLRVYIESSRFKLGGANTTHAVAIALTHGLIVV